MLLFVIVCKEKDAELTSRTLWYLKPNPGTDVISHGFSTGG